MSQRVTTPPWETRNNLQHRKEVEDEFSGEFSQIRLSGSQDFLLSKIIYGPTFGSRILVILVRSTRQNIVSRLREPLSTEHSVLYTVFQIGHIMHERYPLKKNFDYKLSQCWNYSYLTIFYEEFIYIYITTILLFC